MHSTTADFRLRQEILRDQPVGYWPLDTLGFARDFRAAASLSPGAYTGTFSPIAGPFGTGSSALLFDGLTGGMSVATPLPAPTAYTWEFWIWSDTLPTTSASSQPATNGPGATATMGFSWSHPSSSFENAAFHQNSGGGFFSSAMPSTPAASRWHHMAGTWDGSTLIAWLNGVMGTPAATTGSILSASTFYVANNTSNIFPGRMAHVALFNYALSPARIAARIAATRPRSRRIYSFVPRPMRWRTVATPAGGGAVQEELPTRPIHLGPVPSLGALRFILRRMLIARGLNFEVDEAQHVVPIRPRLIDIGRRYNGSRGQYRIFNAAGYSFYRSNSGPPNETDIPFATSATLPATPSNTYADGTWYLSMSYFNGCLSSGFLPLGPHGETYLLMEIAGGAAVGDRPSLPSTAALQIKAGGVIRINAVYVATPDGANRATEWSIAYTTDGTTPPNNTPTATKAMTGGALQVLAFDLPAQANGTVVKVQLQTRRGGTVYSFPGTVLVATADATGPTAPAGFGTWAGALPEEI
jgi:hypothetical protein